MALSSGVGIQEVSVRIQYKKDNKSMEKVCMKVVEEVKKAVQHAEVTVDTERFEVFLGKAAIHVYNSTLYCMIFLGHKDDFIVFINGEEVYAGLKERSKTGPHKADIHKVSS